MLLSNVFIFAGVFPGTMVSWLAPSGRLALRYATKPAKLSIKLLSKTGSVDWSILHAVSRYIFLHAVPYRVSSTVSSAIDGTS